MPAPSAGAGGVATLACEGARRVDVDTRAVVVHLDDGRSVRTARASGAAAHSAGEALTFRHAGLEGEPARDEGGRFACRAEAS